MGNPLEGDPMNLPIPITSLMPEGGIRSVGPVRPCRNRGPIRDDFAGPGGWSYGLNLLGLREDYGIEFDATACETARLAGHQRWHVDVTSPEVRTHPWSRRWIWLYIASPPCQTFSMAGNGAGRKHLTNLVHAAKIVAAGYTPEWAIQTVSDEALDERSLLVLEPLYVITRHLPRNVALEQVPPVLPIWEAYAVTLRELGYSVWTGYVFSEQYGVPQTRKRAVLMASLDREVHAPTPTHSRYHSRSPQRLDDGVLPWVSMAQALQWGMTERPSMTVTGGGTSTGGAEPFGNAARQTIRREAEEGRWALQGNQKPNGVDYQRRDVENPAQTITGETGSFKFVQSARSNATERDLDEPAPTITSGHDSGDQRFVQRSNYSAGGKPGQTAEERGRTERDLDQPSVALTSKGFQWIPEAPNGGDTSWSGVRPSPTIVGSFAPDVVAAPGYRKAGDGPRQSQPGSIRVSVQEAGILQSFPADYPWQGKKGKQFEQVGNAVPPVMAAAIIASLLGLDTPSPHAKRDH